MDQKRVLILGAGPAGVAAAEAAAARGAAVTLCGAEPYAPYFRPRLPRLLAEPLPAAALAIRKPEWFEKTGVTLRLNARAVAVDAAAQAVTFADGSALGYDALVLAVGAECFIPPVPGAEPMALRSYDDAVDIRACALERRRAVVVGGGLLGLETAWELNNAGAQVTVIERLPWLLPRQLNREGGDYLQKQLEERGFTLHVGADPADFQPLYDGACVVVAAGIRPCVALAQAAGAACERAVVVDEHMATSLPGVFACGDAAQFQGRNWGLMPTAQEQGKVAGANAAGDSLSYVDAPPSPMLKVGTLGVFSTGDMSGEGARALMDFDGGYGCAMLREDVIVGAALVGNTSAAQKLRRAVAEGRAFPGAREFADILTAL